MDRGSEPAFPIIIPGRGPELGLSIREYVSIEILAKLFAEMKGENLAWCVQKADEATDLWLAERGIENVQRS